MIDIMAATLLCTGLAPTVPKTIIELEVKAREYSTIRYEIAEDSLSGTGYIQSVGFLHRSKKGMMVTVKSGDGPNATRLEFMQHGSHLMNARLTHYISGMKDEPVDCEVEDDSGSHEH
ncbi:MAG: hypothetical protein KF767_17650 [Bdellovibrionaceae bacterium]|nr:hypothetical protein [Pseudobdellovibrionaceae bacterium]